MTINFIGDIYLKNKVAISKELNLDDIILNLEAPFSNIGTPAKNKINLFMDEANFFDTFAGHNILAVNLANNHIMDYGEEAFDYTLDVLKNNNIPFFGAGKKQDRFNNPLIIKEEIALFGYACPSTHPVFGDENNNGAALFEIDQVINEIKQYTGKYCVVVSLHWGQEYFSFPKPEDVIKARRLIDAGADLIIGHHPHTIQSFETYKNKHIFYSIGNGIFHNNIVNSMYNGTVFMNKYKMKYSKLNRISILVTLDAETKLISNKYIIYNSKKLEEVNSRYLNFRTKIFLKGRMYKLYRYIKFQYFRFRYQLNRIFNGIKQ